MHRSFTSCIILKMYQNVQSDSVRGGRDTSCVAIAVDRIAVPQINATITCMPNLVKIALTSNALIVLSTFVRGMLVSLF